MADVVITLVKVRCDETTDDFLEGLTDEFGWRLSAFDTAGDKAWSGEEVPMPGMESVDAGSEHTLNRELGRLGPEMQTAELEFWDKDTFGPDDLLGRILIRRGKEGGVVVTAGESATDLGGGAFRLLGEQGDYTVWVDIREA
jgi:hypothetical protein